MKWASCAATFLFSNKEEHITHTMHEYICIPNMIKVIPYKDPGVEADKGQS